jgi:hypothetical protein
VTTPDEAVTRASPSPIRLLTTGLVTYAAGLLVLAALLYFGPPLAEQLALATLWEEASDAAFEAVFMTAIFGIMLLVALAFGAVSKVRPLALGRRKRVQLPLGLFAGVFGVAVATAYAGFAGSLDPQGPGEVSIWLAGGAAVILLQAGAEEVYFRGWMQPALERAWGTTAAVLCTAIAFCILHVFAGARSPVTLVNLFLGGLLFGVLAAKGRGILGAVAAHFAWNGTEQLMLGLDPNPGVGSFGTLLDFDLTGPSIWGGSEEGLNASLAMSVALAVLLVPLVLAVRRQISKTA